MSFVYFPYSAQATAPNATVTAGETITYEFEELIDASVAVPTHPVNMNALLNYTATNNEVTDVSFVTQGFTLARPNLISSVASAGVRQVLKGAYQTRLGTSIRLQEVGLSDASLVDMMAGVLSSNEIAAVAARRSIWSQYRSAGWEADTLGQYRTFFDSGIFKSGDSMGFVLKVTIPKVNVVAAPTFVFPGFTVIPQSVSVPNDETLLIKVIFTFDDGSPPQPAPAPAPTPP